MHNVKIAKRCKSHIIFRGSLVSNCPSSLPLCVRFPGSSCGFPLGASRRSLRSNATFSRVPCVTPRPLRIWSTFCPKRVVFLGWEQHVFSRPRFLPIGLHFGCIFWKSRFLFRVWGHFGFSHFGFHCKTPAKVEYWCSRGQNCGALLLQNS